MRMPHRGSVGYFSCIRPAPRHRKNVKPFRTPLPTSLTGLRHLIEFIKRNTFLILDLLLRNGGTMKKCQTVKELEKAGVIKKAEESKGELGAPAKHGKLRPLDPMAREWNLVSIKAGGRSEASRAAGGRILEYLAQGRNRRLINHFLITHIPNVEGYCSSNLWPLSPASCRTIALSAASASASRSGPSWSSPRSATGTGP